MLLKTLRLSVFYVSVAEYIYSVRLVLYRQTRSVIDDVFTRYSRHTMKNKSCSIHRHVHDELPARDTHTTHTNKSVHILTILHRTPQQDQQSV